MSFAPVSTLGLSAYLAGDPSSRSITRRSGRSPARSDRGPTAISTAPEGYSSGYGMRSRIPGIDYPHLHHTPADVVVDALWQATDIPTVYDAGLPSQLT